MDTKEFFKMNIGKAIKLIRLARGWTLADLAWACDGVSIPQLSLIERGKRNLSVAKLAKICEILDIQPFLLVAYAQHLDNSLDIDSELWRILSSEILLATIADEVIVAYDDVIPFNGEPIPYESDDNISPAELGLQEEF